MSEWSPVIADEKLTGLNRLRRPTAPAGQILVLLGKGGTADVLQPGTTPTAGEMMLKNYDRAVTLTASPHPARASFEIPSKDVGIAFTVQVSLDVHVTVEYAAAAAQTFAAHSDNADDLISQRIEAIVTPICGLYGFDDRVRVEQHVLQALQEQLDVTRWGFAAGDIAVTLRLPAELEKAIGDKHAAVHKRETEAANLDHNQRLGAQRNEFGREQKLLDTTADLEDERRRSLARDELERADRARELELQRAAALQAVDLDRERKLAALQIASAEKEETLRLQLQALEASKQLGELSESDLLRMHVLQDPEAAARILRARTQQIDLTDQRMLEVLHQMIDRGEIDLRRDDDRRLLDRLLPGGGTSGGGSDLQLDPAPPRRPAAVQGPATHEISGDDAVVDGELDLPDAADVGPLRRPADGAFVREGMVGDARADGAGSGGAAVEVDALVVDSGPGGDAPSAPGHRIASERASSAEGRNPFGDEGDGPGGSEA